MEWKEGEKEKLKQIIKQVTGTLDSDDAPLIESALIKGSGDIWCYGPLLNRMVLVARGTRVHVISEKEDKIGRVLIYTAGVEVVYIDKDELIEIGFN